MTAVCCPVSSWSTFQVWLEPLQKWKSKHWYPLLALSCSTVSRYLNFDVAWSSKLFVLPWLGAPSYLIFAMALSNRLLLPGQHTMYWRGGGGECTLVLEGERRREEGGGREQEKGGREGGRRVGQKGEGMQPSPWQ